MDLERVSHVCAAVECLLLCLQTNMPLTGTATRVRTRSPGTWMVRERPYLIPWGSQLLHQGLAQLLVKRRGVIIGAVHIGVHLSLWL